MSSQFLISSTKKNLVDQKKILVRQKKKKKKIGIPKRNFSPVHVVLVSLLVDQLFSLFLPFLGRPKKEFGRPEKIFGIPKKDLVHQKKIWSTKKMRN